MKTTYLLRRQCVLAVFFAVTSCLQAAAPTLEPIHKQANLEIFVWRDVCNVYVVRDHEAAMLIDVGDGSVLEHLKDIGVQKLEWVLFTHHHREQCQGHPKLRSWKPQVGAPQAERALFEKPTDFRKLKPSLGDRYSVHGASYVRPPVEPLAIDRGFKAMDTFTWRGLEFWCLETAGNSPGGMSYLLKTDKGWLAFSGDVMLAGARMHNYFDTEWDYGFAKGLYTLIESASLLDSVAPVLVLPSHGAVIREPKRAFKEYQTKLRNLTRRLVRGYEINTFANADQDKLSRPSAVPHLWQTTPHLYKFKGPNQWPNATFLVADSGRVMMVDCGLGNAALDAVWEQMRARLGAKSLDMILVTHMHGDHVVESPYARQKYGTKLWTLDRVAEPIEQPTRFDYAAMAWSYGQDIGPIQFDRKFKAGEKFSWEGYEFTIDWMPGQTEFGCCIHGMVDGKHVAFTGDNLFANAEDPNQDGHEALCARNSAILEEGYIYGSDYLRRLKPDLIMGGHSFVMDKPKGLVQRYHKWSLTMRDAFQEVSAEADYRYMFDPFWVRADPYRLMLAPGGNGDAVILVRNFLKRPQTYRVALHCPEGITAEPSILEGTTPAAEITRVPVKFKAASEVKAGAHVVGFDTTLDGKRYGEWFDMIVGIRGN